MGIILNNTLAKLDAPLDLAFAYILLSPFFRKIVIILFIIGCLRSLFAWQFANTVVGKLAAKKD
ncbi:MAG: hypothetical protein R3Y52_03445 [Psittacicella sp.]